jgi:hypothetical protein
MPSGSSNDRDRFSGLRRQLARMRRRPIGELFTAGRAAAIMLAVEFLVRIVPLPVLARRLGTPLNLDPAPATTDLYPVDRLPARAQRQLRCAGAVADLWPFSAGPCLRRALVAGHMIRSLHPSIRLGVRGSGEKLVAHAWLELDGRALEPVEGFAQFERLTLDAPPPLSPTEDVPS